MLVRSRAKDRRRALAARMEEPLEEHSGLAAADHTERAAVRDGLRRVLEGLSREERRLFTLRFVYGLSSAELGGVLGLSPNGVDARVSRLRKKLKRLLARQGLGPVSYTHLHGWPVAPLDFSWFYIPFCSCNSASCSCR